jgi:hypothetical protein
MMVETSVVLGDEYGVYQNRRCDSMHCSRARYGKGFTPLESLLSWYLPSLWVKTTMVFKRPDGWVNLLIEATHPLGNIGMDAVSELAGASLLGFIGLTTERTAVLKLPDAEVAQYTFAFL